MEEAVLWEEPPDLPGKPGVRKTSLWDGVEEGGISPKSEPSGTGVHCLAVLRERTRTTQSGGGREKDCAPWKGQMGFHLLAGFSADSPTLKSGGKQQFPVPRPRTPPSLA